MLKKLTGIAAATALAIAIAIVATLIEAPSARAEAGALTAADLQSDRGTVLAIDMETRTMVVETVDGGDIAYPVLDGVQGFSTLKVGTKIELRFYRVVDVMVAKTTPQVRSHVRALLQDPSQAPDIPGTKLKTRLWGASGVAARIDTAADKVDVAQGGMIYRTPTIRTAAGVAALKTFKAGDMVTLLFTEPTAVEIKPIQ
ncbi:hypothetical protein [Reyranella sp.]|uniref:hypothetical protein n=1 Tax=Reyranella sp. TaxID=1929291 RepID=UPI003D1457EE